jgi:uncharacterized protein YacL
VRTKLVLRLILAFLFATFAAIYSQLIPPLGGTTEVIIRVLLTVLAGLVGYLVFPSIARPLRVVILTTFNFVVTRVSSEISTQILRFQRPNMPIGSSISQFGSTSLAKPIILDTSAIIDGRLLDIAKVGFISGLVLVPKFVLTELQQVSDSSDDLKRQRGRRGFDTLEELKKIKGVRVEVWDKDQSGKFVDEKIVNLAKGLNGKILTTDFNLNKLATISNLTVLNVNDLANAVKTISLPGEKFEIKIMHMGKDKLQGVGYLNDGTMVVISQAAEKIGKTIKAEVTKNIQTPAGRMIFAKTA